MSWPGIEPGPPRWEESTLAKSYSNSVLIAIQNIYNPILIKKEHCTDQPKGGEGGGGPG